MRVLLLVSFIIFTGWCSAQDTLVYKSGKIQPTRVISLEKENNIVVHTNGSDTLYTTLSSLEQYMIHSELSGFTEIQESTTLHSGETLDFPNLAERFPVYQYGKFSVGTNLTAPIPFRGRNSRVTIEPEYTISSKFSIKIPLTFGLGGFNDAYSSNQTDYSVTDWYNTSQSSYDGSLPELDDLFFWKKAEENTIAQIGFHPKFYFFTKHKNPLSLYALAGFNIGIATYYQLDRYHSLDTIGESQQFWNGTNYDLEWITNWEVHQTKISKSAFNSVYYNLDFALGLDFNFSKGYCMGIEAGYRTRVVPFQTKEDRLYRSVFGGENEIYVDETPYIQQDNQHFVDYFKFRLYLIYRFGGYKNK